MKNIRSFVRIGETFMKHNAPAVLTGVGMVGVVGTAVLTGRATLKAYQVLEADRALTLPDEEPKDRLDQFKLVWLLYLPPVGAGLLTIGSIFYANRINAKRLAAMATAYTLADRAHKEYEEKVKEHITGQKHEKIQQQIAQDRQDARGPIDERKILLTRGPSSVLCYDEYTGRPFWSTHEKVMSAINKLNNNIINGDQSASLTDFYNEIGLPPVRYSDDLGWNTTRLIEPKITWTHTEDNEPCMSVDFEEAPQPDFYRFH